MRRIFLFLLLLVSSYSFCQTTENIIIITTDGFRWQDVFRGMDTTIANNKKYNEGDSAYLYKQYWSNDLNERRNKLFPFLWSMVAARGQIYGNRDLGSKVDNANPYWFSYPGYNEIFTGYPDTAINSNSYPPNPHVTVLEYLNKQPKLKGRIAAFGAWDAFDRILNEQRAGIPVISAFDAIGGKRPTANEKMINKLAKDSYKPWHEAECLDVFTHHAAMEWLKTRKPKVLYISYGETDEWAHAGFYRSYLDAAHQVDAWIREIWEFVQSDPQYHNKTSLFITVDHGRGDLKKEEWTGHGSDVMDSHQIWFAVMGPQVAAKGECKTDLQFYQKQFAQTMAHLLGYHYTAEHPIGNEIKELTNK
jgi:hypothetical protein